MGDTHAREADKDEAHLRQTTLSVSKPTPQIIIIGGGMSGLLMAIRLRQAGIRTFKILEKADGIGGTWRDNTYPGLKCDVPAHLYTYSFEPNPEYSHRFASGPEIQSYLQRVCDKYQLRQHIQFSTTVDAAEFDHGQWTVTTSSGERFVADIVITACGFLHQPKYPEIPGLKDFDGNCFHTARWDHDVDLTGKRVGVIGTGSTAVQVVPAIAEKVGQLSVFQRTPQWIFPMRNKTYGEPQKQRLRKSPSYAKWMRYAYSKLFQWTFNRAVVGNKMLLKYIQWQCENHLRRRVRDPELQNKLRPNFHAGCKRLIFGSGFYFAVQRPHVSVVTEPIERVVSDGIVTSGGQHHPLDVIVMATGFHTHQYMRPMRVVGENGTTIEQLWQSQLVTHRSVALPGFPNFFTIFGPYSPIGNNSSISVAEIQVDYLMQLIGQIVAGQCDCLAPKKAVSTQLLEEMQLASRKTVWYSGCDSWYFDANGNLPIWPWTLERYKSEMKRPKLSEFVATRAVGREMSHREADAA